MAACGDKGDDTVPTDDTASTDDTGPGGGTTTAETVLVFPSGDSTWTGTAELTGVDLDATFAVTRTGGTLEGTVSLTVSGADLTFGLLGTIDDQSGQFALVPTGWVGDDPGLGMVGLSGVYDAETSTLTGMVRDTTSWDNPTLDGGPFSASSTTPPDEVELASITADPQVTEAGVTFSGTSLCTSDARPVEGTLARGSDGQISGTLSFSELDGSFVGTFGLLGVEDAVTGDLTLVPTPWTEEEAESTNYANYYAHGTVTGGSILGTAYLSANVSCPDGGFDVTFE